jgi:ribose transport system ATP-binding protein
MTNADPMTADRALDLRDVCKDFASTRVLRDVSLAIMPGEVHSLVGHNGSGKSTLIKILAGYHAPTSGSVGVGGQEIATGSVSASRDAGLRFVHQELGLVGRLTALENVGLGVGYHSTALRTIDWEAEAEALRNTLARLGVDFDLDVPVVQLRAVDRALLAIARAIGDRRTDAAPRLLVLDEPTTALERGDSSRLFDVIAQLAALGTGILYVSHRMDEIRRLSDRISILRDGSVVHSGAAAELSDGEVVRLMLSERGPRHARADAARAAGPAVAAPAVGPVGDAPEALRVERLSTTLLTDVDLSLRAGEILGVAGLAGSGREHVAYALCGALEHEVAVLEVGGRPLAAVSPRAALRAGMVLLPGNRLPGSLMPKQTVRENMMLLSLPRDRFGGIRRQRERRGVQEWIARLDIQPPDPEIAVEFLSGGNKQKLVMAKGLNAQPHVLLIDEPTAGVDVGARVEIIDAIKAFAREGGAVIITSSDVKDLIETSSRVIALHEGRVIGEFVAGGEPIAESEVMRRVMGAPADERETVCP